MSVPKIKLTIKNRSGQIMLCKDMALNTKVYAHGDWLFICMHLHKQVKFIKLHPLNCALESPVSIIHAKVIDLTH